MRRGRTLLWGNLPIKRSAIPELLSDLSTWPTVDTSSFDESDRAKFNSAAEAVRLFVEERDVTLAEIKRLTGVHREQLYRQLSRCLSKAEDGRIQGFRALIPHRHIKDYTRSAPVGPSRPRAKGGAAGAFSATLSRFSDVKGWLDRQIRLRHKQLGGEVRKVRMTMANLHKGLLERLKAAGVKDDEYPFNRDMQGLRSLQAYERAKRNALGRGADDDGPETPPIDAPDPPRGGDLSGLPQATLPFDAVQFDGHKIDGRFTLRLVDPFGMELLFELTRIWILVALDVITRAALGFQIVLAPEYDSDEVAQTLQSCFGEPKATQLTMPGLAVREGGGFPREVLEAAKYPRWRWFQFDSARANIADATLTRLTDVVGCFVATGRLGEPDDRAFIERFFGTLASHGFHQIPGTTGSSPTHEVRHLGDVKGDTGRLMSVDELEQVVYVMLADYNGQSHTGLGGRSPLEAMRYWLNKPGVAIRQLPAHKRKQLMLLQEARITPIVGGGKSGRQPHINFEGVRYTSDLLRSKPELIGKKLKIYFNIKDIRQIFAFFEDGSELGALLAAKSWRKTAHSLRLRKEILRLVRLGKLQYREGDDAIEAWAAYKRRIAATDKRAATALARQQQAISAAAGSAAQDVPGSDQATKTGAASESVSAKHPNEGASAAPDEPESATPEATGSSQPRPLRVRRTIVFGGNR